MKDFALLQGRRMPMERIFRRVWVRYLRTQLMTLDDRTNVAC